MSGLPAGRLPAGRLPRAAIGVGAGLAAAAAGAAVGLATERLTAGRARRRDEPVGYGSLHGDVHRVSADDGTALHVEVDEPAADADPQLPTVVFSHGFCLDLDVWHHQRLAMRGRHRLVLWDQRGHGRSGLGPDGHYTVDQCGADLRAVLDAVVPDGPIVLVGHSMGAMTSMALAAARPALVRDRVVGVALLSTSAGGLAEVSWGLAPSLGRLVHRVGPLALTGLARAPRLVGGGRRLGADVERALVRRYSYATPVSGELARFTARVIAATPLDVVAAFWPGFDQHDKAEALAALDGVEALVLSGADDLLTPPEHSEQIVRRLPGAEHVVVPHAGHLVMLEHPEVVDEHLLELLDRADRTAHRSEHRAEPRAERRAEPRPPHRRPRRQGRR